MVDRVAQQELVLQWSRGLRGPRLRLSGMAWGYACSVAWWGEARPRAASGKWQPFAPTRVVGWLAVLAFLAFLVVIAVARTDPELRSRVKGVWEHVQKHGLDIDGQPPTTVLPTSTVVPG